MKARHLALIVTVLGGLMAVCAAQPEQPALQSSSSSTAQSEPKPSDTPAPKPKAKRVFTNDDIPSSPDADKPSSNSASEPAAAIPASGAKISANDMREIVRRQKTRLATATANRDKLQQLMEKLPHSDCRNLYYPDDPKKDVCADVAKVPGKLKQAQNQVDKEQSTLEQLERRAKQMGYGSSVYNPD